MYNEAEQGPKEQWEIDVSCLNILFFHCGKVTKDSQVGPC